MTPLEITLVAVLLTALFGFFGYLVRELSALRTDLAVIRQEVKPDDGPSLSHIVGTHSVQIAVLNAAVFKPKGTQS